jgi:hypothetical protein
VSVKFAAYPKIVYVPWECSKLKSRYEINVKILAYAWKWTWKWIRIVRRFDDLIRKLFICVEEVTESHFRYGVGHQTVFSTLLLVETSRCHVAVV